MKGLTCLCLLFFSFIVHGQGRNLNLSCSSSCGELRNISYPFRLKGDPADCGDHDYELDCQDNNTVLVINSGKYHVKHISYDKETIRVLDAAFFNVTCNLPSNSLTPSSIKDDYRFIGSPPLLGIQPISTMDSWVSFANCSKAINDQTYILVPCASRVDTNVYAIDGRQTGLDLKESCTFLSMVPTFSQKVPTQSFSAVWKILTAGFELEWSVRCRDCRLTGQTCRSVFEARDNCSSRLSGGDCNFTFVEVFQCGESDNFSWIIRIIKQAVLAFLGAIYLLRVALILLGRFVFAPICIFVFLIYKFRKTHVPVNTVERFLHNQLNQTPARYSYTEILGITNHFNEKLGQGGFGSVFKGKLPIDHPIAVKMLSNSEFEGEDFISEVSTIGRIHHVNVVPLVGFCSEGSHRALIYEYMPNGSLDKYIFSKNGRSHSFSWEKLNEIALGIARGIDYLHQGCDMCILHFDIKPHNILLDHDFTPKVSDFGLAKLCSKDDQVSVSKARGTIGYIAPELVSRNFGVVSPKSDVYSFGMLLLEMAGGRKNVDTNVENSSEVYFPSWVYDHLGQGKEVEIENPAEIENEIARKLCMVGLWCIQTNPRDRPSMSKVAEMLEGNGFDVQMPPKPFLFSPPRRESNNGSTSYPTELSIATEIE